MISRPLLSGRVHAITQGDGEISSAGSYRGHDPAKRAPCAVIRMYTYITKCEKKRSLIDKARRWPRRPAAFQIRYFVENQIECRNAGPVVMISSQRRFIIINRGFTRGRIDPRFLTIYARRRFPWTRQNIPADIFARGKSGKTCTKSTKEFARRSGFPRLLSANSSESHRLIFRPRRGTPKIHR